MGLDNPGLYHKGDPAMAFVPPIEQTVMNVALAPFVATGTSVLKEHHALIMTPTATKSATTMTIGGGVPKALSGGTWTGNAPSGFSFYSMPLTEETSTYYFENAAGLSVLGYGLGSYESYYYLAASSARQLNPAFYLNDIHFEDANEQTYCAGEFKVRGVAQMQLQSGSGAITWFIDGQEQTDARDKLEWTIQSLELDKPHEITMIVKAAYNEVFTLKTKITVVNPQPLKITGERFICPPAQSVTLKAGDGPARYQWYLNGNPITGATQKEWTVTRQNAGQYTVIGFYGTCQSPMSDTVTVVQRYAQRDLQRKRQ
nr:MAG TPA: Protein sidekick-1 adhesion, immunoglobulin [Caudoviricetes sp.]